MSASWFFATEGSIPLRPERSSTRSRMVCISLRPKRSALTKLSHAQRCGWSGDRGGRAGSRTQTFCLRDRIFPRKTMPVKRARSSRCRWITCESKRSTSSVSDERQGNQPVVIRFESREGIYTLDASVQLTIARDSAHGTSRWPCAAHTARSPRYGRTGNRTPIIGMVKPMVFRMDDGPREVSVAGREGIEPSSLRVLETWLVTMTRGGL